METAFLIIKWIFLALVALSAATIPVEVRRNYFLQKEIKMIIKRNATKQN